MLNENHHEISEEIGSILAYIIWLSEEQLEEEKQFLEDALKQGKWKEQRKHEERKKLFHDLALLKHTVCSFLANMCIDK